MKLWDTETGQCLKRFSNGKIPYVIRFHPDQDKQHIFLAGMSDKKIVQVCLILHFARRWHHMTPLFSMTWTPGKLPRSMISILVQWTQSLLLTKIGDLWQPQTTKRSELGTSIFLSSSSISPSRTCTPCPQSLSILQVRQVKFHVTKWH